MAETDGQADRRRIDWLRKSNYSQKPQKSLFESNLSELFCDEMGQVALLESFQPNYNRIRDSLEKVSDLGTDFLYKYTFGPGTATKNLEIEVKKKGEYRVV